MKYFEQYFEDVNFDEPNQRNEVKVICPFHDDTNPSANIDVEKSKFFCYTCDKGHTEASFFAEVNDVNIFQAQRMIAEMTSAKDTSWKTTYMADYWADQNFQREVEVRLNLSHETQTDLQLGMGRVNNDKMLAIPVFFEGQVVDVRRYNILNAPFQPKLQGNEGAKNGWVIPYDIVKHTDRDEPLYVMEGEKDMIVAREQGLNAMTFTGGAGQVANDYMDNFIKERVFILVYDNDQAGRDGAATMANHLLKRGAKEVRKVDISELVPENKGDFADFILKKKGDIFEFLMLEEEEMYLRQPKKRYTTINQALENDKINVKLTSFVAIAGDYQSTFSVPSLAEFHKDPEIESGEMNPGESRHWVLEDWNVQNLLALIEQDAKKAQVITQLKSFAGIDSKEKGVKTRISEEKVIYKFLVQDRENNGQAIALDMYAFEKMEVGKNYEVDYSIYPHPTKNQKLVAIAKNVTEVGTIKDYAPDSTLLSQFQMGDSVEERVQALFQSARHYVANHMNFDIWLFSDLVFNSILDFDFNGNVRGALDVFILGDTQVGKSETTGKLAELYNFGHFLSLKTSTEVGLIGGADRVDGSYVNKLGAIPRQHKGLVIMEEFSGAPPEFIKKMTDIRSSNTVRITRASGELVAPSKVRMITISNPKNSKVGAARNIKSFPNGVTPLMELITSAEDIARYDGFLLAPKPEKRFNPFAVENQISEDFKVIDKKAYEHKADWVYTRVSDNVIFQEGVKNYIWEKAEELNSHFESSTPIFGTTANLKLARFSVALASMIMSTDSEYENVIVTKEVVDYIADWLFKNYSSDYFKLDKVREEWLSYTEYSEQDLHELEVIYPRLASVIEHLGNTATTNNANIRNISGMDDKEFRILFQKLVALKVVTVSAYEVTPTEKFRRMYRVMNRTTKIEVPTAGSPEIINDLM